MSAESRHVVRVVESRHVVRIGRVESGEGWVMYGVMEWREDMHVWSDERTCTYGVMRGHARME